MNCAQPATQDPAQRSDRLLLNVGQYSVAGRKEHNEDAIGIRIPDGNLLTTKGAAAVRCRLLRRPCWFRASISRSSRSSIVT